MTTTTGGVLGAGGETQSSAGARSDSARRLGSSGTEVPIWRRSGNSPIGQSTWPSDGHSTPKGRPQNDKDMTSRRAGPSARFCSSAPPSPHSAPLRCSFAPPCYGATGVRKLLPAPGEAPLRHRVRRRGLGAHGRQRFAGPQSYDWTEASCAGKIVVRQTATCGVGAGRARAKRPPPPRARNSARFRRR